MKSSPRSPQLEKAHAQQQRPNAAKNKLKKKKIKKKKQCVREEITRKIRNYFEMNENENAAYPNLWHAATAVLQEIFILKKDISSH